MVQHPTCNWSHNESYLWVDEEARTDSTPPFSRFRKSFPTSFENQGLTYIKILSPTVCTQVPTGAYQIPMAIADYKKIA